MQSRQAALGDPLKTEAQSLQAAVDALNGKEPDAALKARATAFQTKQDSCQQELQRLQQNFQATQANVLRQINAKLGPAITPGDGRQGCESCRRHGQHACAQRRRLDVTNDVLAALNAALPSVSVDRRRSGRRRRAAKRR